MLATSSARLRPLKSAQQLAKDSQVTGNCHLHQVDGGIKRWMRHA